MATKWTDEQLAAIKAEGNVIVSAGAGSGKTAVLTERIVSLLKEGNDISNFLVLTFTKAAAAEMKDRVRIKLIKENDHLNLQKLDSSYITTIDAFTLNTLEKYYYKLGLKSGVKVLSSEVNNYLNYKYLEEIFDDYYKNPTGLFKSFMKDYLFLNDKSLIINFLGLKSSLDKEVDPIRVLNNYEEEKNKLNLSKMYEEYVINAASTIYDDATYGLGNDKFNEDLEQVLAPLKSNDFIKIKDTLNNIKYPQRSKTDSSDEEILINKYNNLKKKVNELKELVNRYPDISMVDEEASSKYEKLIIEILLKLYAREEQFMYLHNSFTYSAISRLAIKLMDDEEVINDLKNKFKYIMVDEYQDTSNIQEMLINKLENNNVYVVGDMKQSIYLFRSANPKLFKNKYDKYSRKEKGHKIDLSFNFRSNEKTIDGINKIFKDLMTASQGGVNYKEGQFLLYGNKTYDKNPKNFNTYLYEGKSDNLKEIFFIGNSIKEKIENKDLVLDKDGLRPCTYKDFAIILRTGTNNEMYKEVLNYFNIPSVITDDLLIDKADILILIRSFLKSLDLINKNNDEKNYYLLSLARSFVFNMDDDICHDAIVNKKYESFPFYSLLEDMSKIKDKVNTRYLIDRFLNEFNVLPKISTLKEVNFNLETLNKFLAIADEFSSLNLSYKEFYLFLDSINDFPIKLNIKEEVSNGVTITNIHKSKGLEYPICYYPSLNNTLNRQDLNPLFLYDSSLGFILKNIDNNIKYDSFKKYIYKDNYMKDYFSEFIRLYYVALTRAKEEVNLIMPENCNSNTFGSLLLDNISLNYQKVDIDVNKDYFKHKNNYLDLLKKDKKFIFSENKITSSLIKKASISKEIKTIIKNKDNLNLGTKVHEILEYLDFKNPSNIPEYKEEIECFLNSGIDFKTPEIYKEYEFIYEEDNTLKNGVIDLLLEYPDKFIIIDYKLSNIDDDNYNKQLNEYKTYLNKFYHKPVEIYLYSFFKKELKEIK